MKYYIADPHFFHSGLNEKMDERGFASVEEMNSHMIKKWNGRVRANDDVIVLGDFSFGTAVQTNELMDQLNGRLFLITGNHDRFLSYRQFDMNRFGWVRPYTEIDDRGRTVILCHYPIMCYNGQYKLDRQGKPQTWMLYGHVHDTHDECLISAFMEMTQQVVIKDLKGNYRNIASQMINCFCMFSDYTPLTLDEWIENDRERRKKKKVSLSFSLEELITEDDVRSKRDIHRQLYL